MTAEIVIGDVLDDDLQCPNCRGNNMHQGRIEIFNRRGEDSPVGMHLVVDHDTILMDQSMIGNPSSRRQGLRIHLECETCDANPVLCIVQHKGFTLISFENTT